ncbi:MAG: YggS family pyridoxal phosphate-dependent enzyme [Candidatus Omnitrophica bacterium]|nr:YggS family pyridoxal phosphate-dependent enzyme [Candidatus Omnitrophota bacterium]
MIKENIERVRRRIGQACVKIKADPGKITIVCVTKGRTVIQIQEAASYGLKDIGENRVQEAMEKYKQFSGLTWHMIGHLQSNKVKEAVKIFDFIHSVDSISLVQAIDKQAARINKIQDVFLEVKTSPEAAKFGFSSQALNVACAEITKLRNIKIKGLMTIAPLVSNAEEARPYFAELRQLRDKLNPAWLLSMGMSDDFLAAIEEGADIIRLGRAIFEDNV